MNVFELLNLAKAGEGNAVLQADPPSEWIIVATAEKSLTDRIRLLLLEWDKEQEEPLDDNPK